MKVVIKRSKKEISQNSGSVKFENLTTGEVLSMLNALRKWSEISPVANDVYSFFLLAIKESNWEEVLKNH